MTGGSREARRASAIALVSLMVGVPAAGCGSRAAAGGHRGHASHASHARHTPHVGHAGDAAPPDPAIAVFPTPGDRVATAQTQITFRGIPITRLGNFTVTGSRSGLHTGRLVADSDGKGGSFLPAKPFVAGELVTVRTRQHILDAHGSTFHFTVGTPSGSIPATPLAPASRVAGDLLTFQSRPDLQPPAVELTKQSSSAAPGDIFLTPQQGPTQNGAMILDPNGTLVWFQPVPKGDLAADLSVQTYHGQPVLTWWQGFSGAGIGAGEDLIYDSSYRRVAVVKAGNGLSADLHDFLLTPQGTALITAYNPVLFSAKTVGGSDKRVVLDSVVQEIDIKTGLVLFQWDSLDHVPLDRSYEQMPHSDNNPYDYFHINSIQLEPSGNLVISGRNTWAAYELDRRTGATLWTLGGKRSTYKLGSGVEFAFQHDVRVHSAGDDTVTLFDDGAGPPKVHSQSRGITVRLNADDKTATLVTQDLHSPALASSFEGNEQELPGGDEFLGWGQQPYFTEFDQQGQMVFDGRFVGNNSSYRAFRFAWTGKPSTAPAIAATGNSVQTNVYASWNGATGVSSWQVLGGASPTDLRPLAAGNKQGFETEVTVPAEPYVAVQALDSNGHVLATSKTVSPTPT